MRNIFLILILIKSTSLLGQYCTPPSDNGTSLGSFIEQITLLNLNNQTGPSASPYYNFYNTQPIPQLASGSFYTLDVTTGTAPFQYYTIFIDWNNDNDFNDANELIGEQLGSLTGQVLNFLFQVPTGIFTNVKRMRIRCSPDMNMDACTNYSFGETEDYRINVTAAPGAYCYPISAGGTGSGAFIEAVNIDNLTNSSGPSSSPFYKYFEFVTIPLLKQGFKYDVRVTAGSNTSAYYAAWVDWNEDGDFLDTDEKLGEGQVGTTYQKLNFTIVVANNALPGIKRLRIRAANTAFNMNPCNNYSSGETEDYNITIEQAPNYCTPTFSVGPNGNNYISALYFGAMAAFLPALPNPPYYENISPFHVPQRVEINKSYVLTSLLYAVNPAATKFAYWIDFNQDGDFNDADEKLSELQIAGTQQLAGVNFNVPFNAKPGTTRIRVICANSNQALTPCGNYTEGECKDYPLTIYSLSKNYCLPQSLLGAANGDFINGVIFGFINNQNSGAFGGNSYHIYENPTQLVPSDSNQTITIESGSNIDTVQGTHYAAWIDYNKNNLFENTEKLGEFQAISGTANELININFLVPANQEIGFYTLRIRAANDTILNGSNLDACQAYQYGETEDYKIYIQSAAGSPTYCSNLHNFGCPVNSFINSVSIQFSTLSNTNSGCNNINGNAYTIWPPIDNKTTTLVRSAAYSLIVDISSIGAIAAWIDYDQNGTFDATEYIEFSSFYNNGLSASNYLVISDNTPSGYTKIRIRSKASGSFNNGDACTLLNNGETEDYWIYIAPARGLPPVADFSYTLDGLFANCLDISDNFPDISKWFCSSGNPSGSLGSTTDIPYFNLSPGCYSISLYASNHYGTDIKTVPCALNIPQVNGCSQLMFSEYFAGQGNNKAIELVNSSSTVLNLSNYTVELYPNGSPVAAQIFNLNGSLQPYDVFVIKHPLANLQALTNSADATSFVADFNGNDAIVLKHNGNIIDVIGQIGVNPGTNWNVGFNANTSDYILIRKNAIDRPNTNWQTTQNEWDAFAQNQDQYIGNHNFNCGVFTGVAPTASFSASINSICVDECINFIDSSAGNPSVWQWTFNGANISQSNLQNPSSICYSNDGIFDVSLTVLNQYGQDSITLTSFVTVNPLPIISITQVGPNLVASGGSNLQGDYQWYLNGNFIPGAINPTYTPVQNGVYFVYGISTSICTGMSDTLNFVSVSTINNANNTLLTLFPNPVKDELSLQIKNDSFINYQIEIYNNLGQKVSENLNSFYQENDVINFNTKQFNSGIYLIKIFNQSTSHSIKFVKQ